MEDNDFKLEVLQRLTKLETLLIGKPACIQNEIVSKIMINRKLIFIVFAGIFSLVLKTFIGG